MCLQFFFSNGCKPPKVFPLSAKILPVSEPALFNPVLFKGQLHITGLAPGGVWVCPLAWRAVRKAGPHSGSRLPPSGWDPQSGWFQWGLTRWPDHRGIQLSRPFHLPLSQPSSVQRQTNLSEHWPHDYGCKYLVPGSWRRLPQRDSSAGNGVWSQASLGTRPYSAVYLAMRLWINALSFCICCSFSATIFWVLIKYSICIIWCNPQKNPILIPISEMRTLRHREIKSLVKGHKTSK